VQQARSAAVGARRLGAEGLGLLLQEGGERTLGQASGRGRCDLLQRPKVDLGAGAGLAEGATGNDFSPLGRQVTDFLDLLRRESALRHEQSCLVLTSIYLVVFLLPCYHTPLRPAKGVLASGGGGGVVLAKMPHPGYDQHADDESVFAKLFAKRWFCQKIAR